MPPPRKLGAFCNASLLPNVDSHRFCGARLQHKRPVCYRSRVAVRYPVAVTIGWENARTQKAPKFKDAVQTSGYIPGAPIEEPLPLTIADLMGIVKSETPDSWPNEIIRLLLGWRQMEDGTWDSSHVPDEWREKFSNGPPDFINETQEYTREVDLPVKLAVQKLTRSILPEHKNGFREVMKPAGFPGWKVKDLTPNRTRRAVCVNYIIFWYRMHFPDYVWE